jgi:hypothetical protein
MDLFGTIQLALLTFSLSRVISKGLITYDSEKGNEFVLAKADGSKTDFKQSEQGLYYVDMADHGSVFINTVADNQIKYTSRDCSRADAARRLQQIIGLPSTRDFVNIVNKNLLLNCTVTAADIKATKHIYSPDVGILKEKTVRRKADEVLVPFTDVPSSKIERYQDITVSADIMKVNGMSFFMSISQYIKFGTAEFIESHHAKVILKAVTHLRNVYAKGDFRIVTILMDGEFESLRPELTNLGMSLNTASRDEHVPEIERRIRTVKELVRGVWNTIPFIKSTPSHDH